MRKPPNVVYGVDDKPPLRVTALSGLQHVGLMSIYLVYPILVLREVGGPAEAIAAMLSLTLAVMALGTALQATRVVGSGFLCPAVPSALYLVPSLLAARQGGLALVFGMTILAGLFEIVLARALRRLRPVFPPEIAGLVILFIGLITGALGVRLLLGVDAATPPGPSHGIVAVITLSTMVALNVWAGGVLRIFCALIGMTLGYAATAILDGFSAEVVSAFETGAFFGVPRIANFGWSFDASLLVPFAIAAVAATLKAAASITTCQKLSNAQWVRADLRSVSGGATADGLTSTLAGTLGAVGLNTSTLNVGLAGATGVLSRRVAYAVAAFLLVLAFLPKLAIALYFMPPAVSGAALLFAASFIIVSGLDIVTSRLLDTRRVFVIGFAVMGALAVDLNPGAFLDLPEAAHPFVANSLVLGTAIALVLNLLFRIGVRRTQTLVVASAAVDPVAIEAFIEANGATWGARRDVIERARFNLVQSVETIVDGCEPEGPIEVAATFDEFRLDVRIAYDGAPLELPESRPSDEDIMASEAGERKLAGYMLKRYADRVTATHKGGRSTVLFHFDH